MRLGCSESAKTTKHVRDPTTINENPPSMLYRCLLLLLLVHIRIGRLGLDLLLYFLLDLLLRRGPIRPVGRFRFPLRLGFGFARRR